MTQVMAMMAMPTSTPPRLSRVFCADRGEVSAPAGGWTWPRWTGIVGLIGSAEVVALVGFPDVVVLVCSAVVRGGVTGRDVGGWVRAGVGVAPLSSAMRWARALVSAAR